LFPSIHYQSTGAPSTNRQISSTVLTSFLLSLSQTALITTTTTVTRNVTARLAKTIATATVIVGTGKGTGTVAGETETTVTAILTVIGNAQTVVTAIGIATETVNVVVIVTKDARASRKNVDGSSRAKTTDVDHSVARTRGAPLVVPAAAAAASATVARQIAVHPHLWARSRSRNGSVRPVVGTSMHLAMSSTLPCRQSKPVRIALFGIIVLVCCC
jgi:hypothetical protein